LFHLDRLAKSADYHMKLRPKEAGEVAVRRKAEVDKKRAVQAAKDAKAQMDKDKATPEPMTKGEPA
jgi:hypothetical protein